MSHHFYRGPSRCERHKVREPIEEKEIMKKRVWEEVCCSDTSCNPLYILPSSLRRGSRKHHQNDERALRKIEEKDKIKMNKKR